MNFVEEKQKMSDSLAKPVVHRMILRNQNYFTFGEEVSGSLRRIKLYENECKICEKKFFSIRIEYNCENCNNN